MHGDRAPPSHGLTKQQRNLKNALVAVNPTTGGVLAYYGGSGPDVKGYDGKVDYNDYAGAARQPAGSSFKPYTLATVLTQTLKQTPGQVALRDQQLRRRQLLRARSRAPRSATTRATSRSAGPTVELTNAMKYSLNTTFDQLAVGRRPDNVATTAHAMGIATTTPTAPQDARRTPTVRPTFGIGIGDYPVTALDQADGFATLANGGMQQRRRTSCRRRRRPTARVVYQHQASAAAGDRPAGRQRRHAHPRADRRVLRRRAGERPRVGGQDRHRRHRHDDHATTATPGWSATRRR